MPSTTRVTPAAAHRRGVEKPRQRPDHVPIEDRQVLQVLVVEHDRVAVGVRRSREDVPSRVDGDLLRLPGELEHERLDRQAPRPDPHIHRRRTEPLEFSLENVGPGGQTINQKLTLGVGDHRTHGAAGVVFQCHPGALQHRAGLVLDDPV